MHRANKAKQDEFYTQRKDIEEELKHYKSFFENKTVFCNCDDPFESEFFKYFALNFNHLKLRKLICTSYAGSPISHTELDDLPLFKKNSKMPYMIEITEVDDYNKDGKEDLGDIEYLLRNNKNTLTILDGDGDFRSEECVEFLKEADIVVTNPPFSLFREFLKLLVDYKKDFIIIGNTNSLSYKEVFQLFKNDKIRTGYTKFNVGMFFRVPDDWKKYTRVVDGIKLARVSTSCWLTTLPVAKHKDVLVSYRKYMPDCYPKYDNYDAININNYKEIPEEYYGVMGVPITFLDKYNPEQFELIGQMVTTKIDDYNFGYPYINGKRIYARILIKRRRNNDN